MTYTLSTKTFGKKAKKEVVAILPNAYRIKRHSDICNIYDKEGKHIAYVTYGRMFDNAVLRVF